MSHSKGVALALDVKSDSKGVGVDLEFWRESLVQSRHLFSVKEEWGFCKEEQDYLRLWTAKESVYKACAQKNLRLMDIRCVNQRMSLFQVFNAEVSCCVYHERNYAVSAAVLL